MKKQRGFENGVAGILVGWGWGCVGRLVSLKVRESRSRTKIVLVGRWAVVKLAWMGGLKGRTEGFKGRRKGMAKIRLCSYLDGLD